MSPWTATLPINDTPVHFKLDSGADSSVLSFRTYQTLRPAPDLTPSSSKLVGPSGRPLAVHGHFLAASSWQGRPISFRVYVSDGPSNLLSRSVCATLGLLHSDIAEIAKGPSLGCMSGPPVNIELTDDARPFNHYTAHRVPLHLQDRVKAELDRMVALNIITPVTTPTDWCSPMVAVLKRNGQVRLCVDLRRLNQCVKRAHYQLPTIDDTLGKLAGAKYFSTLDTTSGFWQVPLSPKSAPLTTFITPFGRFHFNRLPFGITSAPEIFQQRLSAILSAIPNVTVFIDDILIFGRSRQEHDDTLHAVKSALNAAGVTLNAAKSQIGKTSIRFLGHIVSADGVHPDPDKVRAITNLPEPSNVPELRRALGMFNFLCKFLPSLASISAPLRKLLQADASWVWDEPQKTAFTQLKAMISSAPGLALFDVQKPIIISADASSYGLGAVLLQPSGSDLKPVAFASRSLSSAETRYAQIEKECLAVAWACDHFHHFIFGAPSITVQTDHKPLVPLINHIDLNSAPLRCQRLLLRLLRYSPTAVHVPGKSLAVADTLSRAPDPTVTQPYDLSPEVACHVDFVVQSTAVDPLIASLREATTADDTLQRLASTIQSGWPSKPTLLPPDLRAYFPHQDRLSVADGLLYYGTRVVVPTSSRQDTLVSIHDGHQGVAKCRARASQSVWWPGISRAIDQYVASCPTCSVTRPNPTEPLQPSTFPTLPWLKVACDLCDHHGTNYLIAVDYFSRYIEAIPLRSTTSQAVIKALHRIFATHGIPCEVVSDNGPQFASAAFATFAKESGFQHRTSSPRFAQSNGAAERAVQTAKRLLSNNADLDAALLAYRSTPLRNGYSPAELLFGRRIRSHLPRPLTQPCWPNLSTLHEKEMAHKEYQTKQFNRRHRAKPLPELSPGSKVCITDSQQEGTVQKQLSSRSYLIATKTGVIRRNRFHLKSVLPPRRARPCYV